MIWQWLRKKPGSVPGKIGRTRWLCIFEPIGWVGDVTASVDRVRSTLKLAGDDLLDLSKGLTRLMAASDRMEIYNFN